MLTMGDIIRSILARIFIGVTILIFAIPMLIFLCLPKKWLFENRIFFWFARCFYNSILFLLNIPITYSGHNHITATPAVIVVNHQSSLDIPLVGSLMDGYPHLWLAWANLMKSPLLRFVLPRVAVLVDMSTPRLGMRTLIQAIQLLQDSKRHVIIFPEGGRYIDGIVHPFYGGFVSIAKKLGRPVIPVKIIGVDKVYPPGSFWLRYAPIEIRVGEPMLMQENESDEAFKQRVHQWYYQ